MKGNLLNNGYIKDTEISSYKNTDMIDTSSVFHSSCSTLNNSKQDTAYEDNSSLMKSVNYKKTLFCNQPFRVEHESEHSQSLISNGKNVVLGKKRKNLEHQIETPKKKISTIIKIPKFISDKLPCQINNIRDMTKSDEQNELLDSKIKKVRIKNL